MDFSCKLPRNLSPVKKKTRFNGVPIEEIVRKTLPDLLIPGLDMVIIGINPGLTSALRGHHYAGPSNHFWKCLNLSGLTPQLVTADDDLKLLQFGIGFTNVVERTTKSSADLNKEEMKSGCKILLNKLQILRPKIAVFNGKIIFEVFANKKKFNYGLKPGFVEGTSTYMWVMPSSSARSAHFPSPSDKLPFYTSLKKLRDFVNCGVLEIKREEFIFPFNRPIVEKEIKSQYFDDSVQNGAKHNGNPTVEESSMAYNNEDALEPNLKVLKLMSKREN